MDEFLRSLNERRIWRVLLAYPGVTFIWLQAVEFFINNYQLDARLLTASLIVAVVLFPAAVIWNWRHGEVGSQAVAKAEIGTYLFFAAAAIVGASWFWTSTPAEDQRVAVTYTPARSIAVMPFENASDDASVQFLCDGIAEGLINWLATVPDVKVISKSAAFRLRDSLGDTAILAAKLGVDGVIRGRLERIGEQIVVSTSFVDTRDDRQLWGERLVRPVGEVIYLERSIVDTIKKGLGLEVSDAPVASNASGGTDDPRAYEHYLRGHFLIQSTNNEEIYRGLDELRAAIAIDPQFALPHADVADALSQMISYGVAHDDELVREAQNSAYAAVALAPQLAEAQTALATVLQYLVFDWEKVDAAYDAAVALNPQTPVPYHRYADYLSLTLRPARASEMAYKALSIDSLDSSSMHSLGIASMIGGDFATAAKITGDWNQFHPNSRWSYVKHALMLSLNGECDLARQQVVKVEDLLKGKPSPLMDSWIAWGLKVCGDEELYARSKARIEAANAADPGALEPGYAYLYALEGDDEALLDFVSRVVNTRNSLTPFMRLFLTDHLGFGVSATIPSDPRYLAILEELNFPPRE